VKYSGKSLSELKAMKKFIRHLVRKFGYDIYRYNPGISSGAQVASILSLLSIDVVFDVGANSGQFGREIRDHGYKSKIVSFEPLSSARTALLRSARSDSNWVVHPQAAIGAEDGFVDINVSGNSVSSSVLPMLDSHSDAAVDSKYIGLESVPMQKMDSVADRYLLDKKNLFIKIDTQGYEWQVLDGARITLQKAKGVLCELSLTPLYDGQYLWLDLISRLESEGFTLWAMQKGFTDSRTGRTLQLDAIFIRV
jgi:FkbM family methyltransferase